MNRSSSDEYGTSEECRCRSVPLRDIMDRSHMGLSVAMDITHSLTHSLTHVDDAKCGKQSKGDEGDEGLWCQICRWEMRCSGEPSILNTGGGAEHGVSE
jgi:hypothetical protein